MKNQNIQLEGGGLKCDNCDWKDASIPFDKFREWIGRPCPKCESNLLTEEDFVNSELLLAAVDAVNSLSEEELDMIAGNVDLDKLLSSSTFSEAEGLKLLAEKTNENKLDITFDVHKEIKITKIKKSNKKS